MKTKNWLKWSYYIDPFHKGCQNTFVSPTSKRGNCDRWYNYGVVGAYVSCGLSKHEELVINQIIKLWNLAT
jgi:hypothetical protein